VAAFDVARFDEMPGTEVEGGRVRFDVRRHFGIGSFGTSAMRSTEGGMLVREHHEAEFSIGQSGQEELYVVVSGHATFTVNGEQVDAPSGTMVFVRDPAAIRSATAEEPGTTVFMIGGKPGEAFFAVPAEVDEGMTAYNARDFETAIENFEQALEKGLQRDAGVLFNIACCQALLGRTDAAIDWLEQAIRADDQARELARTDEDLDSLREDPRFVALVGR
jgi:tetratricopeptide (TPR) repeat protein